MRKNFEWFQEKNLQHKVDDLVVFIETDMQQKGFNVDLEFHNKIQKSVNDFIEEDIEVWLYDNNENFNHFSCFIKFKGGNMVEWLPFWIS